MRRYARQGSGGNPSCSNQSTRRLSCVRRAQSSQDRRRPGLLSGGDCRGSLLRCSATTRRYVRAYGGHRRKVRDRRQSECDCAMDFDSGGSWLVCPSNMFGQQSCTDTVFEPSGRPNRSNGKFRLLPYRFVHIGCSFLTHGVARASGTERLPATRFNFAGYRSGKGRNSQPFKTWW